MTEGREAQEKQKTKDSISHGTDPTKYVIKKLDNLSI